MIFFKHGLEIEKSQQILQFGPIPCHPNQLRLFIPTPGLGQRGLVLFIYFDLDLFGAEALFLRKKHVM